MTNNELSHALIDLGKSRTDVVKEIKKRYREKLTLAEFSKIFREVDGQTGAKADRVKSEVQTIINDWKCN